MICILHHGLDLMCLSGSIHTMGKECAIFLQRYCEEFLTRIALVKHFVQFKHVI